jgi:CubicO group peptidase (beta-lactamase class C family)
MNVRLFLFVSLAAFAGAARAPSTSAQTDAKPEGMEVVWPDTPAGRWAKGFFEAYNTDADDALRRFVKEYYSASYLRENPLEKEVEQFVMVQRIMGKWPVHAVRAEGDFVVYVTTRAKKAGWMDVRIALFPEPPHDMDEMRPLQRAAPGETSPKDYDDWEDLSDLVKKVRRDAQVPALAAAVVHGGKIVDKAVTGVRRVDRPDRVQIDDRFHLASCTKSWTATMIARLVENGDMRWDMTIGDVMRELPMRTEYKSVSLEHLLQMRGGVPTLPTSGEFAGGFPSIGARSPLEARAALVRQVLNEQAVAMGKSAYSNAGYVVAGYMAERATKRSWEELMRTLVFEPLGLRSAGIGWPATKDRPNQPYGHLGMPPDVSVSERGESLVEGDIRYIGPAGNVHCSIEDFARFAAFHLQGLRGRDGLLKAETVRHLHTPPQDTASDYACGWHVRKTDEGEVTHSHGGGGGIFVAHITLYPDSDLAIVMATNRFASVLPYLTKMRHAIYRRMKQKSGAPGGSDGVQWPDTIAARRAREFVKAINADDEESLRRFVAENYSPVSLEKTRIEDKIALFQGMRGQMGTLTVSSVEVEGEFSVVLVGKAEALGIWGKFTIKVEKDPPHYWTAVTFLPTAAP